MLEDSEFTNRVLRAELSKKFPNKVDIKHGLDVNKIKCVNNFPVYNETDGFKSNARPNVDSFMFTSRQSKYDVPASKHTSVGQIQPYFYNKQYQGASRYSESNVRMKAGAMSSLYGMPPDRDIILENPTAQAMNLMGGQMTEEKLRNHNFRVEGSNDSSEIPGEFFSDPRVVAIIEGGAPPVVRVDNSVPMQESTEPEAKSAEKTSRPIQRKEDDIVVEPAFKKTTSDKIEDAEDANGYDAKLFQLRHQLDHLRASPNDQYTKMHKDISDTLVKLKFDKPDGKIKLNSKFVEQVEDILTEKRKKKVKPNKEHEHTDEGRRRKYHMDSIRESSDDEMHFEKMN